MARKVPRLAKLTRPRLHKAVPRERLYGLLDEMREHAVVWIAGPPGAGKTTLAASYLEAARLPVIWYQFDSGDSDPASFFYYLRGALEAAATKKAKPLPLLTPEYLPDLTGFSRRFFRHAFARLPEDVTLVFDNYQEAASDSALHSALAAALEETPNSANIFVISRNDPPAEFARAVLNARIGRVGWSDLRLTPEETVTVAVARGIASAAACSALHTRSGGWMAGLTLLLERLQQGHELDVLHGAEALDTVFDYFAGLIFDKAAAEEREVLMKTSLLPRITSPGAEAVTGNPSAIRYIEGLHRRHVFTDRTLGDEPSFQYHALFRAFLANRARSALPAEEWRGASLRGARYLESRELVEEAFAMYLESEDWAAAETLFISSASRLIAQGRWLTVDAWGRALPAERVSRNPRLRYWLGRSKEYAEPSAALPWIKSAHEEFRRLGDQTWQLLCAISILEVLFYDYKDLRAMDPWAEAVITFLAQEVSMPSRDDELRANAAVMMWAAHRLPQHGMVGACVRRVQEILPETLDVNLRLEVATLLLDYSSMAMDTEAERIAVREGHALLGSPHLSALRIFYFHGVEGYAHYIHGQYKEGLACFDKADKIASEHCLEDAKFRGGIWRGICQRRAGLLSSAEATLRKLEKYPRPAGGIRFVLFNLLQAGIDFDRGRIGRAVPAILEAHQASVECGHFSSIVLLGNVAANMAIAGDRLDAAREVLERVRAEARGPAENFLGAAALNEAWLAHRLGDNARRDLCLRDSLQRARDQRARERIRWYPNALSDLLPVALDRSIEPEVAISLAREFRISPSAPHIESWPWPIKIHTLGRFEILLGGQPLRFSRKVPRKALALLKALVAMGGKDVPLERLSDVLWPDEEGDAAHRALTTMLHRLRGLLGAGEAIGQRGGRLFIDPTLCWVDALAFEYLLSGKDPSLESAVCLYRGAFLAHEENAPWAVSLRERLRARFVEAVVRHAGALERRGDLDEALRCYRKGLEADDLVERFYQGLMRCYERLGRRGEAASTYEQLRHLLSVRLGARPSPASEQLYQVLRA